MINVRVFINTISAERFWEIDRPFPPVKISTNLNVVGVEKKNDQTLEIPFVFTINYVPAVAQINIKGKARVSGSKNELEKIYNSYKEKKPPPPAIIQPISNMVFIESVLISRTVNIPPPIPLPQIPQATKKKPSEPSYRA
ncbi:hypothetical protein DRO54_02825 [Candidatus Bathyarchaeota archaeon]|nr:MAG: hypothetical protein DRO54_02825 [Candidatus Bathyarchaeota archaeon]